MNNFLIILKIEKFDVKDDKSVSFNNEIKYFVYIINCRIIIIIERYEILKRIILTLILFKIFIILLIFSEFNIIFL